MGALHKGHQQLIREANRLSENTLVSVFINPLQFDSATDLEKYPRTHEGDCLLSEEAGAKFIWFPSYQELYPSDPQIISAGEIGKRFEGASRPGHFDGMLTVVKRYFDLINPEYAIFGEKDWQQLCLIRKMVKDQNLSLNIVAVPTVRESSGLALSSRNSRLS
jgi:pantoate--beta-alanine ligase